MVPHSSPKVAQKVRRLASFLRACYSTGDHGEILVLLSKSTKDKPWVMESSLATEEPSTLKS